MSRERKRAAPPEGRAAEPSPREHYVFIGVIAKKFGVHPQTLRLYDAETVERLEIILTLTRELGVNLAGVEVILDLKSRLARMEGEVGRLMEAIRAVARDHASRGGAARDDKALAVRPRGAIVLKYE